MSTQLAVSTTAGSLMPSQGDWSTMMQMADTLIKSGLAPEAIRTPQAALIIMEKGREMNLPPLYALSNIAVIKGKPVAGAELLLAVIYRDHGDNAIKVTHTDNTLCTVAYKRRAWDGHQEYSFTIEDAKAAGLTGNQTWQKYPAAMLRARCISAVARLAFPDSIGGLYTPDELGADVVVTDEGAVEIAPRQSEPETAIMPEPTPPATPETATPDEVERANDARAMAVELGYVTERGTAPNPVTADLPRRVVLERMAKWERFINECEARDAHREPVEVEVVE